MLSIHKNKRIAWSNINGEVMECTRGFSSINKCSIHFRDQVLLFLLIRFVTRAENLFNWFRVTNIFSILI